MKILVPTFCLALTLASAPARPEPPRWAPGPVFRVDTPRAGARLLGEPQAAQAPGGDCMLAAWLRGGRDRRAHVISARQLCPGRSAPEIVLVRAPQKTIVGFSLSAGWHHYALAWTVSDPSTGLKEHFARIFDIFAVPVGPPFRIETPPLVPGEGLSLPYVMKVGIDDSGRLVVAWVEEVSRESAHFFRARARRYALDGTPGTEVLVGASRGGYEADLAVAPDGSYMVAWVNYDSDPAATEVLLHLYGPDDAERSLAAQPGEAPGACPRSATESPALAAGYDRFFVAFVGGVGQSPDGEDPRCLGVFAQVYDLQGGLVRGEFRVKRSSWFPIVRHDRSRFLVAWEAGPIPGIPAPGGAPFPGLYAHSYNLSGHSEEPELRVQPDGISGMALDPARALLVWAEDGGVFARYLER